MESLRRRCALLSVFVALALFHGPLQAGQVKFTKRVIQDRQGFGIELCQLLAPADWRVDGGVNWKPGTLQLMETFLQAYSPDGSAAYEIFPVQLFLYSQDPYMNSVYSQHTRIHPPLNAQAYLENIFIPNQRGHLEGFRITQRRQLPNLARESEANFQQQRQSNPYLAALTQGVYSQFDAASLTMEYRHGGRTYEETVYTVCTYSGTNVFTNWGPIRLYSLRSAKDNKQRNAPILKVVSSSFQVNPLWEYKISQVCYMMVQQQRQALNSIGELSRYISRTNDEISDMLMSSYRERERVFDKSNAQWSEYIRGVEPYRDPVNNVEVEVPNNFERAWSNGNEYIFSDDPGFDPNRSAGPNWTPLERIRR